MVIASRNFARLKESADELATTTGAQCLPVQMDVRKVSCMQNIYRVVQMYVYNVGMQFHRNLKFVKITGLQHCFLATDLEECIFA